ncbi:DNA polymerase-4 [Desulfuromusa kysingii]|uniref:DNA polymerase IV n=1 Tax=Desulfuromusa kysingii TaxID=37625 RepID=A0A1H3XNP8_9BACT|nr:DNA polymerase IV [Desulfuromusa kysingii]SEA00212.1 DNA polymerase-4 [Desulfuromusa kysingii]
MVEDQRKIIHIDMDAFYASVEQRDNPELRGKPIAVGGNPDSRGVVATCSYEARRFGIHSAMSSARAYRLCPHVVFVRPRFDIYQKVSQQIREIFLSYTDLVEPLSLDEAYLDVTTNKANIQSATWVAQNICQDIRQRTMLTASAGVSYNKFLAKIASDVNKPAGLTVVTPDQAAPFIAQLPIRRFHGVGRVTEKKMKALGILTGADLRTHSLLELQQQFGKAGQYYFNIARGVDLRPVVPNRIRKSIGKETTLDEDITDIDQMMTIIGDLSQRVGALLESQQTSGMTLTLKVKYADFQIVTRSFSHEKPIETAADILEIAGGLLKKTDAGERAVRLLGVTVSHLTIDICAVESLQMDLPFV